ncbi:membrane protein DedA, SNARE-associated domain [Actinopolyspora lacussalsi subsp. righensis]|uniref:Membrane protein DedA, SNARE-associated domain n=1 Tax=Actinopolyspora righensis TaxID=995060 RepID=A0A1I6ZTR3_9ACTN|nr:DedA family protein [Actinopolyspora righensis]SFT66069.1 membrane protein DedA, SNARE-associated domain [Actinopolyspora righensis]
MSVVSELLAAIAGLPRPLLVVVVGALVLGECTLGIGFVVPGESGLLIASAAVTDFGFFLTLSLSVALFAALGDNIGFLLGRRYGWRLRESAAVRKLGQRHWDRAGTLLRRYGVGAVFVSRFLPVVRTLTPAAAGSSGLGYGRFLPASLLGAGAWSALHVAIGWLAGASAKYVEHILGGAGWAVLGALMLSGAATWLWRRRKARRTRPVPGVTDHFSGSDEFDRAA